MENKILVFYVGIMGVPQDKIEEFIHKVSKKITPTTFKGEIIIIPIQSYDTRVDCINPKYITDKELIQENENLLKELNHNLHNQLKLIKDEENKNSD